MVNRKESFDFTENHLRNAKPMERNVILLNIMKYEK